MLKFGVAFESLIQMSSIELVAVCISTNNITYTCHVHASYCALHWLCFLSFTSNCPPSVDVFRWWVRWHRWRTILSSEVPGKQNPLVHSDTNPLSRSALFYCIRTTTIQLLHAAVVEPLSSAWPVIATVTRWNPLAWVGVVWALMCLLIHACLSCLLLLRVESGLIHRGWVEMWWTCPTVES